MVVSHTQSVWQVKRLFLRSEPLRGSTLCSQECTDGCSVVFARASCEWEMPRRKTWGVPLSIALV